MLNPPDSFPPGKEGDFDVTDEIFPFEDNGADLRCGLNILFRSLASILKYDSVIPVMAGDRPVDKLRLGWEPQEDLAASRPKPAMFR